MRGADLKDLEIISLLRRNSRLSITRIARKVSLPISTVYDRMKRLQKSGVIKKYTCLVDYKAFNYPVTSHILLRINGKNKERAEAFLANSIYTNNFHKVNGDEFNYFGTFVFPSMEELQEFLERAAEKFNIYGYKVFYVLREIREEGFLEDTTFLKIPDEKARRELPREEQEVEEAAEVLA